MFLTYLICPYQRAWWCQDIPRMPGPLGWQVTMTHSFSFFPSQGLPSQALLSPVSRAQQKYVLLTTARVNSCVPQEEPAPSAGTRVASLARSHAPG